MKHAPSQPTRSPQFPTPNEAGREFVNWLLPVYVMVITCGYFVFRSDAVMVKGNALSGDRALFASVNAATLTGLPVGVSLIGRPATDGALLSIARALQESLGVPVPPSFDALAESAVGVASVGQHPTETARSADGPWSE